MKVALCSVNDIPAEGTKLVDFFGRPVLVYWMDGTPKAVAGNGIIRTAIVL